MNNLPYWQQGIKGVKKEVVSKADVRSGDGINSGSGSGNGGGGTDEFAKLLLSRNFENDTLVIPDYITELGPGAINLSNLNVVKLNLDNSSFVSGIAFDFGVQAIINISGLMEDEICSYCICPIIDISEVSSRYKRASIISSYFFLAQTLQSLGVRMYITYIDSISNFMEDYHGVAFSSFFDSNLSKKIIYVGNPDYTVTLPYCTMELDRNELPENILFINYNEQTGEIQNNLFTPDLNYIKGESFVAPWTLEELPTSVAEYLDLENLPDTYVDYDYYPLVNETALSDALKDSMSRPIGTTKIIYKTDIVKDGKNLFFMEPTLLLNRIIKTELWINRRVPLLTLKYQENRWYGLSTGGTPTE